MANSAISGKQDMSDLVAMKQKLKAQGVKHVRIIVVSLTNIIRAKIVPIDRFFKFFAPESQTKGICMAKAVMSLPMYMDVFVDGLPDFLYQVGEMNIIPELETLRKLPYGTGTHAICHVTLQHKEPTTTTKELDICPRTCLRRILRAAEDAGYTFLVGFETEVIFLSSLDPPKGNNASSYLRLDAYDSVETATMIDEMVDALEEQGIGVGQFHAEGAPGQYEFVTDPYEPLKAVDALILTRQTIINIALKYKLRATFAPKIFMNSAGTGSHVHISVQKKGSTPSSTPGIPAGMTCDEEAFLAGLLKHLKGIVAFLMSSTNSYLRIGESTLTGVHIGWGQDNRETPLRVAYSPSGKPGRSKDYRVEVRSLDGSANPYLAIAAILTAGFNGGIKKQLKVTTKELKVNPAKLTEEERKAHGVTDRLPSSLPEALAALNTELLTETLGSTVVDVIKVLKNAEVDYMKTLDEAAQIRLHVVNY